MLGASLAGLAAACGREPRQAAASSLLSPEVRGPKNPDGRRTLGNELRSVLVVGGGLAGLNAALELVERGYRVTVREAAPYLGGRLHTREERLKPGKFRVEHGLHMWFHQYFNSQDMLRRLGTLDQVFKPYEEVFYLFNDYKPELIRSRGPYPLNMVGILQNSPNLNLLDAAQTLGAMNDVIFYDHASVYRRFDQETFAHWAKRTNVNQKFYDIVMEPAASVTLNPADKISAAEMLLYMHYYFVGSPQAFNRLLPTVDHGAAVIDPLAARIRSYGGRIETGSPVPGLVFKGGRVVGTTDRPDVYDEVIIALDVPGVHKVLQGSEARDDAGAVRKNLLTDRLSGLKIAPMYHVMRGYFSGVTVKRPFNQSVIETPQFRPINLVALYHLLEDESRAFAEASGGSVVEFHLYTTPELAGLGADQIWEQIRPMALRAVPELAQAKPLDFALGRWENFTSFECGQGLIRPESDVARRLGLDNVGLAGDWVRTEYPSALMERAVSTGREAANAILLKDNVKQVELTVAQSHGPGIIPQVD